MPRIALVYRGGIPKVNSRFSAQSTSDALPYVDFVRCLEGVERHIKQANPEYDFDTYIHCWNQELQGELTRILSPKNFSFSNQAKYRVGIWLRVTASYFNDLRVNGTNSFIMKLNKVSLQREYAGIAQSLSIRLALNLIPPDKEMEYSYIILLRPDVLLSRDLTLNQYKGSKITLNNSGNLRGDFRFVFNPIYLEGFRSLYNSTLRGHVHKVHYWIPKHLLRLYGEVLDEDCIVAGKDEEVIRKVQNF